MWPPRSATFSVTVLPRSMIHPWSSYPNPDKPELNIDDWRMKFCGIARAAQALAPRVALSFLFKSIELFKYSIWLCYRSCANIMWFQWIGPKTIHLTSVLCHLSSVIWLLTSVIWPLSSDLWLLTSVIWPLSSDFCHLASDFCPPASVKRGRQWKLCSTLN